MTDRPFLSMIGMSFIEVPLLSGIPENTIEKRRPLRYCPSMADCIISERGERQYGAIIVQSYGLSRKEEFLFGSISSKIVNHARYCTAWVVGQILIAKCIDKI